MVDARRPGTVICLVVLGPEWLQAEARTHKALGNDKVIRDERLSHTARLRPTRARRSQTFAGARTVLGSCAGAEPGYARKVGIHLPGTGLVLILLAASVHPFQRSRQPLGASTRSAQTLKIERAIQRGAHAVSPAGRKFQSAGDAKPI